jgi:hypothetical protein
MACCSAADDVRIMVIRGRMLGGPRGSVLAAPHHRRGVARRAPSRVEPAKNVTHPLVELHTRTEAVRRGPDATAGARRPTQESLRRPRTITEASIGWGFGRSTGGSSVPGCDSNRTARETARGLIWVAVRQAAADGRAPAARKAGQAHRSLAVLRTPGSTRPAGDVQHAGYRAVAVSTS